MVAECCRSRRVTGDAPVESCFEALDADAMTLIGRDEELELSLRRWWPQ
jgi:hypothetical protein